MNDRWSRLTRLGWALTIAGVIIIAIEGFLGGNTDSARSDFRIYPRQPELGGRQGGRPDNSDWRHHIAHWSVRPEPRRRRGIGGPTTLTPH